MAIENKTINLSFNLLYKTLNQQKTNHPSLPIFDESDMTHSKQTRTSLNTWSFVYVATQEKQPDLVLVHVALSITLDLQDLLALEYN